MVPILLPPRPAEHEKSYWFNQRPLPVSSASVNERRAGTASP
jgi:hypothetical protein